ncbi:methyltransferase domain-containing protein [Nitriliruptoraceae bacterium ZYF776]|nr:methyltransferase domain-containing protein [Profundirhabdus halotolerans]
MDRPDNVAGWDALADAYQEHVGWVDEELTWGLRCPPEREVQLIGDVVDGARTVVIGCGAGEDLVALARAGAGPLTGVDPSARQLVHARRRCADAGVAADLVCTGAQDLAGVADGVVDLVVSVQAFDYLHDPAPAVAEVRRVLRPGGVLAFSVLHPADVCTGEDPPHGWHTSWFRGEHRWVWDGLADEDVPFASWFRSASEWFTWCTDGGLVVERLLEPAPVDDPRWIERGWLSRAGYAKGDLVPSTILVRARRPS